ncbi:MULTISPECIES: type III secretion system inner membrane ring lipoprotein SctJ [Luteimonas]|jgi:type III secretion protein J|uniref:type III secretion system inner membrane ring lipoprotein SctJ n=1 Tax=Luteimonas TaxID=83614 RepID=UPI000C7D0DB1|nr:MULTISPECIES: type III secretion inner membrane ring lipoprotein SctJ [Luteimonas]
MRNVIRSRWSRGLLVLLAAVLLAACSGGTALYSSLDERQANEMMGALLSQGIAAEKRPSPSKVGWEVSVAKSDIAQAMAVLDARGLPRAQFQNLGDIFKKEGFASSATDERGRYIHGLQQELAQTLTMLPGVANARVHIALPERDPLGGATGKTSAAVMIFEQPGTSVRDREADIKIVVKDAVEGLSDINQVSVKFATLPALPDASQQSSGTAAMALSSVSPLAIGLAALVVVLIAVLLAFSSRLKARRVAATADKAPPKLWQG